jgi:sugar (pentulose or hexulose) kinase
VYEASGLGAAIDCAVGLGLHKDFPTAAAAMTRIGQVFEPSPEAHARYNALYDGVYKALYRRLAPLYEAYSHVLST